MIYRILNSILIVFLGFCTNACDQKTLDLNREDNWSIQLPDHFDPLPVPDKNPMNSAKIELGNYLFFDPTLSKDSSTSCASCHLPQLAFSDGRVKSIGIGDSIGMRNSPVLINLAYSPSFMMDGGVPTLELQVIAPLMHEGEMGFDLFELEKRFADKELYQDLSIKAFDRNLDAKAIAYALAAFQRTLLSFESNYDSFIAGTKNSYNIEEKRGFDLFFSDSLNCSSCHAGFNFTDYNFYNLGLYETYEDDGRGRVTEDLNDFGKFKVPTLRNIELSAPYMHDGSIASLEEVIKFKMTGGKDHSNKSDNFKGFDLNEVDQIALLAFLKTLSDPAFVLREEKRIKKL